MVQYIIETTEGDLEMSTFGTALIFINICTIMLLPALIRVGWEIETGRIKL